MRMRAIYFRVTLFAGLSGLYAQQNQLSTPVTSVPRLVRISNSFHPGDGRAAAPVESVTLSIYPDEQSGAPLWQETQNVSVDNEGRYNVLMGSTLNEGMPLDLFSSSEPRWLGVRFNRPGEVEQARVRLASVPYALKASDADTLGGLPASAYLRDLTVSSLTAGAAAGTTTGITASTTSTNAVSGKSLKPRATAGTSNFLGVFTNATDLGNSVMYQSSGAQIGVNTTTPFDYLHVRFADTAGAFTGYAVQNLGSGAASYSGMLFFDQNGALGQFQGFNNSTHEYRINNISAGGTINFMIGSSSKFQILNSGDVNIPGRLLQGGSPILQALGGNVSVGLNALSPSSTGTNNSATGQFALLNNTTGSNNTANGQSALSANTTGNFNTAVGQSSLSGNTTGAFNTATGQHALFSNTTGNFNTADGQSVLQNNTTGNNNTAIGQFAMSANTTGCCNVAVGQAALSSNTTANLNTAVGGSALQKNTTGNNNTAMGQNAMFSNTTGCCNVGIGQAALNSNTTANFNVAVGGSALQNNTTGGSNTAVGQGALLANTTGVNNVAVGQGALGSNTTANGNTAVGAGALATNAGTQNVAVGTGALSSNTTGLNNIAIGWGAANNVGAGNSGNILIGTGGASGDGNTIRIGGGTSGIGDGAVQTAFFVAGVRGVTTGQNNAVAVMIDSNGQLGTVSSSRRFKEDIQDMGDASRGLMRLRPVTFRYKTPFADSSKPIQYGLIAEEVAGVYPDLVARSADGQIETVKYQVLDSMLLNEVQRQQSEIDAHVARIQTLERQIQEQRQEAGAQRQQNQALHERLAKLEAILASGASAGPR